MAVLDPNGNSIVLSVVYDGPPEAGKTTSLRALARSVGREVYTPEERNGRTVYFDWMEYTGGRFEGAPIRCQIASVPGQRRWVRRRAKFLDHADVVVFVGDTRRSAWEDTLSRLRELRERLDARLGLPVGIVFQANKRDCADAVPIETVRASVDRIGVVESVAVEGAGIREAFVLSVRLALDRVREEQRRGTLPVTSPMFERGEEILEILRAMDVEPEGGEAATPVEAGGEPKPPSADVPSGVIWPPVDGRVILHEVASLGARARATAEGDFAVDAGADWRIHSEADTVFGEVDQGRAALVAWARRHAAAHSVLSRPRCIVLSETGDGRWRLWEIVKAERPLRAICEAARRAGDPRAAVRAFATASRVLVEATRTFNQASLPLPCTVDSIGIDRGEHPVYVGLVPRGVSHATGADGEGALRELVALFDAEGARARAELRDALEAQSSEFAFSGGARASHLLAGALAP